MLIFFLLFNFSFKNVIKAYPFELGVEAGLLPFIGVSTSYVLKKKICFEIGSGIKLPIYADKYYYFRGGIRIFPFAFFDKIKYLSISFSYLPSLEKDRTSNLYKMNWLDFYCDIGFRLFKCTLGVGLDIRYIKFGSSKEDTTVIFRPLIFIYHDIIQWIKK